MTIPPLSILWHIGKWTAFFILFIILQHVFSFLHPAFALIQIPLVITLTLTILGTPPKMIFFFSAGLLGDLVVFLPDGIYAGGIILVSLFSLLFLRIFHVEARFSAIMHIFGGTVVFFFTMLILRTLSSWVLAPISLNLAWNPLFFASAILMNILTIFTLYFVIILGKRVRGFLSISKANNYL